MKKNEFMKLIEKTKKYYDKAQKAEDELFNYIEQNYPDNMENILLKKFMKN